MKRIVFLVIVSLYFYNVAHGQQASAEYPVELTNLQSQYAIGSDIVIKGNTLPPRSADEAISVRIISPTGSNINLKEKLDGQGDFTFKLSKVSPVGKHKINFFGPGNVVGSQFEFEVVELKNSITNSSSRLESLTRNSNEVLANIQRYFSTRPQDSDTTALVRQLDRMATELRRVAEKTGQTRVALNHLETVLTAEPRVQQAAADGLTELTNWTNNAAEADEELKRLAALTRTMPTKCDSLDTAAEGLSFLSTVMNIIGGPATIVKNLLVDKVNPAIVNLRTESNENARFLATEAIKINAAALEGIDTVKTSVVGLAGDTAQFIVGKIFANYCSVLEGTIDSEFVVDQKKGNLSWWKYKVVLKGKFKLWAEKDQPTASDGIIYTGKIEGNAVKVEFFEDIFLVEPPPAVGLIALRKRTTPVVVGNTANDPLGFGQMIRTVTPGHFLIKYKGQLKDDKMALHQESVSNDFSRFFVNRVMIGIIPAGGLIPVYRSFSFPIQKAAWIINRTTKGDFILPVQRTDGKMILRQTFIRDETLSDGISKVSFKVVYNLSS